MIEIKQIDNSNIIKLKPDSDKTFIWDLNVVYDFCSTNRYSRNEIIVDFTDIHKWISANTLVIFLSFLGYVSNMVNNLFIDIRLFSKVDTKMMFNESENRPNLLFFKKFTDKVRFYINWDFFNQIYLLESTLNSVDECKIQCYPSEDLLENWIKKLHEIVSVNRDGFSSNLIPLSSIIDERSKSNKKNNLDKEIKNLTYILWTHMYGRDRKPVYADLKKAEETSANIMFELVKNIYQHGKNNIFNIYGFTTVQIIRKSIIFANHNLSYPYIKDKQYNKYDLGLLLGQDVNEKTADNIIRYLAISIVDFGPGIPSKIKQLYSNMQNCSDKTITDLELIKQAIFSSCTTKTAFKKNINLTEDVFNDNNQIIKQQDSEFYITDEYAIPLSPRGYGWIYCVIFIAQNLGSFNVTSGNVSVTFKTKKDGYAKMLAIEDKENALELAEDYLRNPNDIFDEESIIYDTTIMPGTRIFLEIPINYKWIGKTKEFSEKKNQLIKEYGNKYTL